MLGGISSAPVSLSGSAKILLRRDDAILCLIQKLSLFTVKIATLSYILRSYTYYCIYPFIQDKHATRHLIINRATNTTHALVFRTGYNISEMGCMWVVDVENCWICEFSHFSFRFLWLILNYENGRLCFIDLTVSSIKIN